MSEDYFQQMQPLAKWNPARGVWEKMILNIVCEHWGLFSEPLPTSGMMRNGLLFQRAQQAHHTDENESLLLRTPISSEAEGGAIHPDDAKAGGHNLKLGWQMLALGGHIEPKLPTPNTMDFMPARTPEQKEANRGKGGYSNLREAVVNDLLPTPTVVDLGNNKTVQEWEQWTDEQRSKHRNGNGHGASLSIEAQKLLPTPLTTEYKQNASPGTIGRNSPPLGALVHSDAWGKYAPAIHRWEQTTGHTAPAPTIPDGKDGQHRLNPAFAEFMMGLQPGWVTDCDITRTEMLKAIGNGVVPQQATLALKELLKGTDYVS